MRAIGFATYIDGSDQGPIITAFFYPSRVSFRFDEFYHYIKERGYAIYPGKLIEMDTFRIGNIGEIYPEDIDKLTAYHCRPEWKRVHGHKATEEDMDAVYVQFEALLVEEQEAACRKVRIVLRDLGDWAAFLNARSAFLWALAIRSIMPLCQSFNDFHY